MKYKLGTYFPKKRDKILFLADGCTKKHDTNGNIDKFKALYVAKGFKQIEGVEFSDTFAPTSKPETFKILLALSAIENFFLKIGIKSFQIF